MLRRCQFRYVFQVASGASRELAVDLLQELRLAHVEVRARAAAAASK